MQQILDALIPKLGDIKMAAESSQVLSANVREGDSVQLLLKEDPTKSIALPSSAVQLLIDILEQISKGQALAIYPLDAKLTTQRAADLLNVSRPYLIQLLEKNEIAYHKVGTHRRILLKDLLEYKRKMFAAREEALDDLVAVSQELNLGYEE